MGRRHTYKFSQRRHIDGQQAHKKMLNITNPSEKCKSKPQWYHLTSVRMAIIKKTKITNVGEDVEKR